MKALVVNAPDRGFDFEKVRISAPIGREVLVHVQASGLCHTDVLFATHKIAPFPALLGHEVSGIVAALGPDVSQFHLGDHVVGSLSQVCGACDRCLSGRSYQCKQPESTMRKPTDAPRLSRNGIGLFQGFGLDGFAEQALIHENQLALVPKELPFAQAALLGCGVVTGAGSVLNTADVKASDTVVIFGAGGVGLNAVSGARIAGASRIVVIDIRAKRLDEARRFGTTDVIDSSKTKPVEAVRDLFAGGADHGDPADPSITIGPMVSQKQYDRVEDYIRKGIEEGAEVLVGGAGRPKGLEGGFYVKPTIFVNVTNDMTIAQEEIFGPVLSVIAYDSDDDAIRIANDSKYGLHGAVLGTDLERARHVASQIRAGRVVINNMTDDPQAPWGGFKYNGVGREYGRYGIEAFLEPKAILE